MKHIFTSIILFSGMTFAATENQSISRFQGAESLATLSKGALEVGGNLGTGYSSSSGLNTYLNPKAEYFFTDNLAVGGSASIYIGKDFTSYGLGPSLSYYFWKKENLATLAGINLIYNQSTSSYNYNYWASNYRLGFVYLLNSSVSFGPELTYRQTTGFFNGSDLNLNFQFSIYL